MAERPFPTRQKYTCSFKFCKKARFIGTIQFFNKQLANVDDDISQFLLMLQRVFDVLHDYLKEALGDKLTPDAAQGFKLITTAFTATVAKEYEVIAKQ